MKLDSLLRTLLLSLFALGTILFASCSEELTVVDGDNALFYLGVTEISPGTNVNITPTWRGNTPTNFAISAVKFEGTIVEVASFSVDPETGVFSIVNSTLLETGLYTIDISCEFNGRRYTFSEAIEINMMKPIPDGIIIEPSSLSVSLADILSTGENVELPTAQITTDGSNHVQIKKYLIANVYLNGELSNDYISWFNMSDQGEFSIVPNNNEFEAGIYTFDFRLTTYIVGNTSEDGIFKSALTLSATSPPAQVNYHPVTSRVEQSLAGTSPAPSYKGSPEGLEYAIKSVSPNNSVGITINKETGVLTFPATTESTLGETYTVSLTVTNDYGSTDFANVYSFTVTDFISPISNFSYDDIARNVSGVALTNEVKTIEGDDVAFSFIDLPSELSGLKIDAVTGTISAAKGVELPIGTHAITVSAQNSKNSENASFTINVIANPNYFTYVRWGNNMGLTPIEKYGNQFRVYHGESKQTFEVLEHDIPEGRPVTYGAVKRVSEMSNGTSISTTTGILTITPQAKGGTTYAHAVTVDVTVGEGEEAITRRFPIFVDQCGDESKNSSNYMIEYTPFVLRVNPKTGGKSVAPVITTSSGQVHTGASLDFTTNARYFNLHGPAEHYGPHRDDDENRVNRNNAIFIKTAWDKYYAARGTAVNYGAANPLSYYQNETNGLLNATGGYVNGNIDSPDNLKMIINPEKFVDDYGYADGIMMMTFYFLPQGGNPWSITTNRIQVNRLIVWFDPNYTE